MKKRVREIIKMHLDAGLIKLDTPVTVMDLAESERIQASFTNRRMMKYLEREVAGYKLNDRSGLLILVRRKEEKADGIVTYPAEDEPQDLEEFLMDLVEKGQMQQTIYDVLKALGGWEYLFDSITRAKNELRYTAHELDKQIVELHKTINKMKGCETDE